MEVNKIHEIAQEIFEEVRPLLNADQDKRIREILLRRLEHGQGAQCKSALEWIETACAGFESGLLNEIRQKAASALAAPPEQPQGSGEPLTITVSQGGCAMPSGAAWMQQPADPAQGQMSAREFFEQHYRNHYDGGNIDVEEMCEFAEAFARSRGERPHVGECNYQTQPIGSPGCLCVVVNRNELRRIMAAPSAPLAEELVRKMQGQQCNCKEMALSGNGPTMQNCSNPNCQYYKRATQPRQECIVTQSETDSWLRNQLSFKAQLGDDWLTTIPEVAGFIAKFANERNK